MPLSDVIAIEITASSAGASRAGFGVPLILSNTASWSGARVRSYASLTEVATDFPTTTGPEYLAANALFAQSPKPKKIKIARGDLPATMVYTLDPVAASSREYILRVKGEGVTSTEVSYTTLNGDYVFTAANASEELTIANHPFSTGDGPFRLINSGGALPTGLAADTDYWIIKISASVIQLAASKADALALTEVTFSTDGTGTNSLRTAANDVIVAQFVQGLNAVTGKNYTASQTAGAGDTDTLTITATAAGDWFSIEIDDPTLWTSVAQTHADPGVATDLAAIALEDDDWYALYTLYNSNAVVLAAAAWIETQKKVYGSDVNEVAAITTATGNSDTLDDLHTAAYARTSGFYHHRPDQMPFARLLGRCLPLDPGSETWALKTCAGLDPTALTSTHTGNLDSRAAIYYYTLGGVNVTKNGTTASEEYIDIIRGRDWLEDDMQKGVFNALIAEDKVSFTDGGIAKVVSEVRASLERAVARGILSPDALSDTNPNPYAVSFPAASEVSDADKAARRLTGITFEAKYAGAIHAVDATGKISV